MSKMDDLRAMREAKHAAAAARPQAAAPRKPAARREPRQDSTATPEQEPHGPARCGHRAISGRECTREQGHPEKSHRYS